MKAVEISASRSSEEETASERLRALLEAPGGVFEVPVPHPELDAAIECCIDLLAQGEGGSAALEALASAAALAGERVIGNADGLISLAVARLGDEDQLVREAARKLLVALMELKEINARLEKKRPKACVIDGPVNHEMTKPKACVLGGPVNHEMTRESDAPGNDQSKNSPKLKATGKDISFLGGEDNLVESAAEPIKFLSEKELSGEIDKIASTLDADTEWSLRVDAMQRLEELVLGGATHYPAFRPLLRQLVRPLITQLHDRRSRIVKQACHLLSFLSMELLRDFEPYAEQFIPVLLKNVVITILVIADSADNCIKTLILNCKVSRILPRIIDCARNDRSATIRARCCEYAIIMLENWANAPEIQRSAELYEDLIRTSIDDATSEVRSAARSCYRLFSKIWPGRSSRLYSSFDPTRKKVITDEDGDKQNNHISPQERARESQVDSCFSTEIGAAAGSSQPLKDPAVQVVHKTMESNLNAATKYEDSADICSASDNNFQEQKSLSSNAEPSVGKCMNYASKCEVPAPSLLPLQTESLSPQNSVSSEDKSIVTVDHDNAVNFNPNNGESTSETRDSKVLSDQQKVCSPHTSKSPANLTKFISSKKDTKNSDVPNFQKPLLRKQMTTWIFSCDKNKLVERQIILGDMAGNIDVPSCLAEALALGLNTRSDWMMRVYSFGFVHSTLQQGEKGIQEVAQNFDVVMKLFTRHLDDPHYKVAEAAISTLTEIFPAFKKPFESYLERTLPSIFARVNDSRESIRQQSSTILKIIGESYAIGSLLPAFLRSLDEQKSPKIKISIVEFANRSFSKSRLNPHNCLGNRFLKSWLGKLKVLCKGKSKKLKEIAAAAFASVYYHYDPASLLSFLLSLSTEEQKWLRRMLEQSIPELEDDIEKSLLQRKQKQHIPSFDPFSSIGQSPAKSHIYMGTLSKHQTVGSRMQNRGVKKVPSMQKSLLSSSQIIHSSEVPESADWEAESTTNSLPTYNVRHAEYSYSTAGSARPLNLHSRMTQPYQKKADVCASLISGTFGHGSHDGLQVPQPAMDAENPDGGEYNPPHVPSIHNQAVHDKVIKTTEHDGRVKRLNEISSSLLDMLDEINSPSRELALSLLVEILERQERVVDDCVEMLLLKLIYASKDADMKIVNQAHRCMTIVVTQYDQLKCLSVIASMLVCNDEKILLVTINSLTKLVGRLSQDDLLKHLPSFLSSLLEAFENHSPYVRKTALLCLVEIYLKLGSELLPYLKRLSGVQLQMVTTYTNLMSQARANSTRVNV